MTTTITQVVKQFQQEWTTQIEPAAILAVCHRIGYARRHRLLNPVLTIQLFFVQVLNGNTACTHLRHLTKVARQRLGFLPSPQAVAQTIAHHLVVQQRPPAARV